MAAPLPVGNWSAPIHDLPSGHLPHVPILGNGYLGLALGTINAPKGMPYAAKESYNLWYNTNANWECQDSGKTTPPAHCAMRALGGLTVGSSALLGVTPPDGAPPTPSVFAAEQRIESGRLWSRRTAPDGASSLTTLTYMHPTENVAVTEVTFDSTNASSNADQAPTAATLEVDVLLWMYGLGRNTPKQTGADCVTGLAAQPVGQPTSGPGSNDDDLVVCSRRHAPAKSPAVHTMWSAIALRPSAASSRLPRTRPVVGNVSTKVDSAFWVRTTYTLSRGQTLTLVSALADNLITDSAEDPKPTAARLATAAQPSAVAAAATAYWRRFWDTASIELPSRPALRTLWYGAQYALACSTPDAAALSRWAQRAPPPALYGPFASGDFAFWNGDFTLDYNFQATFYGVFSSNKPSHSAAYFRPIVDWMPAARLEAQAIAKKANITCAPEALHYAAHLAPWGYQSYDTTIYGSWNGPFAALLFINHWEYVRDADFARNVTLPLLRGLNAFAHCYLKRDGGAGGRLVLDDWNALLPDQVYENTPARNPLPGLSLILRCATAERAISLALGLDYPAWVDEIADDLAPFANVSYAGGDDSGIGGEGDAAGALARIWVQSEGARWQDEFANWSHFSSALFPLWPSEAVDGLTADGATRAIAQASAKFYAFGFNSTMPPGSTVPPGPETRWAGGAPSGWGGLTVFSAAARALPRNAAGRVPFANPGTIGATTAKGPAVGAMHAPGTIEGHAYALTARELLDGFDGYASAYQGSNLLLYAPGGGVENAGLSQTVNDLLIQSMDGVRNEGPSIVLFPAWPPDEPAAFTSLRTKGAFLVNATWNSERRRVEGLGLTATVRGHCRLVHPWLTTEEDPSVHVECAGQSDGGAPTRSFRLKAEVDGFLAWEMEAGEACRLSPGVAV